MSSTMPRCANTWPGMISNELSAVPVSRRNPICSATPRRFSARRWVRTTCSSASDGEKKHSRSEEHTSELQSLMRTSYAVFCLKKKKKYKHNSIKTLYQYIRGICNQPNYHHTQ